MRIGFGSHRTLKVTEEHTLGACFKHTTFSYQFLSNVPCVLLDVFDVCGDGLRLVHLTAHLADNELNVHILDGC